MGDENLEIALNGKYYSISLTPLHNDVKDEPIALLKLYITKAQEYALTCQSLENLYKSLENIDTPVTQTDVQIQPL